MTYLQVVPPPISPIPNLTKQPSVGNVLARTSSSGSTGSGSHPHPQRQSSQSSLFEQFASQAKELVRETTRQSSQDGLLAHVDKVKKISLSFYWISTGSSHTMEETCKHPYKTLLFSKSKT